jgi:hypothetical protein
LHYRRFIPNEDAAFLLSKIPVFTKFSSYPLFCKYSFKRRLTLILLAVCWATTNSRSLDLLPDDLKLRFPNITGGIFDISSKSKERELVVAQQTARSISVKRRLKEYLQKSGYDENFVKTGILDSRKAASSLGINLL